MTRSARSHLVRTKFSLFAKNPLVDLVDGILQRETLRRFQEKSWSNLHALNEWAAFSLAKRTPSLTTLRSGKPNSNARGRKVFLNEKFKTYESSVFGHPGKPSMPKKGIGLLGPFGSVDFGITFENDGLRAQGTVSRKSPAAKAPELD